MLGMLYVILFLFCQNCISYADVNFLNNYKSNFNQPLFLTPYLERGQLQLARLLSRCGKLPHVPDIESYSGLITVNKEFNSNIFFWFFPSMNGNASAPILLWLQGGPGSSGLFGLFVEHGPYVIQANLTAKLRDIHWARTYHILYVDNPVGTGFSFTDDVRGYVTNENKMADDMFIFLKQFFFMFSEYGENEFYITGESYAGKYVPALAHKIYKLEPYVNFKLTGVAIGNGYYELETMVDYSDYLFNLGLIDENQAKEMKSLSDDILRNLHSENYSQALVELNKLILTDSGYSLFENFTGFDFYYNYLITKRPKNFDFYKNYVKLPEFKRALHLGNLKFQNGEIVERKLLTDQLISAKPDVTVIMNNYRVLFYTGQLDIIDCYPILLNFLKTVPWKHAEEYRRSKRHIWYFKNTEQIAGYVRNVKEFYEVLVRNAGHILPYDQPEVAFDLISRFVNKEGFD